MINTVNISKSLAGVAVVVASAFIAQASLSVEPHSEKAEVVILKKKAEHEVADWHILCWPVDESHGLYAQVLKQGKDKKHIWRDGSGGEVAEVKIIDGKPFEGLTYVQGGSDYRMVVKWEEGKGKILFSYFLRDGLWLDLQFLKNLR